MELGRDPELRDEGPEDIRSRLVLAMRDLQKAIDARRPILRKKKGPTCRLDQATFDLLARAFRSGGYGRVIIESFVAIGDQVSSEELRSAHRLIQMLRKTTGCHLLPISWTEEEQTTIEAAAAEAGLKASELLEATTGLYLRAMDIRH